MRHEVESFLYGLFLPPEEGFYASIGEVADVSRQIQLFGSFSG